MLLISVEEMINLGKYYFAKPNKITDSGKNFCMLIPLSKRIEEPGYSNGSKE